MQLWIVGQIEGLALAAIDQHGDQQDVAMHSGDHNLVALNRSIFIVGTQRTPVVLKALKRVRALQAWILLPVAIIDPDAVGLGQIIFFDGL